MLFNSIQFLVFFPIVLLIYYAIPAKIKHIWLLVASYYFYMCWNARYAILIFISTVITYISGLGIDKAQKSIDDSDKRDKMKKLIVAASFITNLEILFYYKYYNFALSLLDKIFAGFNISFSSSRIDIILPVGISFYTFQALSYTMDVYRGEIYAEKNFFKYALFVSFFPQLVAGPIERSKNLLVQLSKPKKFDYFKARDGFLLMLWGYFLKIVLADRIAIFVDTVYGDFKTYGGWYLLIATMLFAVQIYCDFAGYSTIAKGSAEFLGIDLMENFDAPYLSSSVGEFWRKWHISLTSWFKDYLYIPLGGSRKGKIRKHINKLIVFMVSGLWHGANITFVIWGSLNGIYQIIGETLMPLRQKFVKKMHLNVQSIGHKLARCFITFVLIDFSWIFFRAGNCYDAFEIIKSIFCCNNIWILFDGSLYDCGLDSKNFCLMVISIMVLFLTDIAKKKGIVLREIILKQDYWFKCLILIFVICFILIFGIWGSGYDSAGFIYFQF